MADVVPEAVPGMVPGAVPDVVPEAVPDVVPVVVPWYSTASLVRSMNASSSDTLRALTDCDTPVDEKQPDAVGKVPNRRCDSNHIHDEDGNHAKLTRDDVERIHAELVAQAS